MSLPDLDTQSEFFSTAAVNGQLFDATDRYRLFAEKIYPLLLKAREEITKAYCAKNGRPGTEPVVLLGVSLLQFLEGMPDRQALEMLRYHSGWNYALNRTVGQAAFHATGLVHFRKRLIEHQLSHVVFGQILDGLVAAGLVERCTRQRLDSTQMMGLVARMSRLENVRETLRLALKELDQRAHAFAKPGWWTEVWERYVTNKLDYRSTSIQLTEKMNQAGAEGLRLLAWVKSLTDATLAEGVQMKLLQRVLGENFTWQGEETTPVQLESPPAGAVQNPHDPQAQWAAKGQGKHKKEHVGYKVQVAETVVIEPLAKGEPTRSFLTSIITQEAIASDEAGSELVETEQARLGMEKPSELYADAAYISAEKLEEARAEGRELIGPAQPGPARNNRFGVEDFDVRVEERQAICPAGHPSTQCSRLEEEKSGKVNFRFEWSTHCHTCPLKDKCVNPNLQHRTLTVSQRHTILQARRREQKTEEFRQKMKRRNAIEGTHSELMRAHGLKHARYRGLAKVRLQNYFTGAACNLKRWIKRLLWEARTQRASLEPAMLSG
jgi:transposase